MNLQQLITKAGHRLINTGYEVKSNLWQAKELKTPMWETLNVSLTAHLMSYDPPLVDMVKPNLPWAEEHFLERVGGEPLNPPPSHEAWAQGQPNNTEFLENGVFSHTYPERIWPKHAGIPDWMDSVLKIQRTHRGIRYEYGDLNDLINLMLKDPLTRQAYLPIWFPEDTGAVHGERVPCTLGYQFIIRNGYFHIRYDIRSCDYFRHFRDDIYLAVKLGGYVRNQLALKSDDPSFHHNRLQMGTFTMNITSLHIFMPEVPKLKKLLQDEQTQ